MKTEDMIKELWSLANAITGFSVVQSLAFGLALGKDLAHLQSQCTRVKRILTELCILFAAAYSYGVWECSTLVMSLKNIHEVLWLEVTCGRTICIWLFTAIPVFGLFAPKILGKESDAGRPPISEATPTPEFD